MVNCISAIRTQVKVKKYQIKNLKVIQEMSSIIAEYFKPAMSRPSPICPATSPEKKPWSNAACEKSRV